MMKKMVQLCVLFIALTIPFSTQALNDTDQKEVKSALEEGDFTTIKDLLVQYDDTDEIVEKLDIVLEDLDNLYYDVDDFENKTWIFPTSFSGDPLTIDSKAIPYICMDTGETKMQLGFTEDDWLFFTTVKIKLSDEQTWTYTANYFDVNRDILDDGTICEYIDIPIDYSVLVDFSNINMSNFVIRFYDEKETTYNEYTMAPTVTKRFSSILNIKDAYDSVIEYIS